MTTDLANSPEAFAMMASLGQPDPVRSRVRYEQPLTNFEKQRAEEVQRLQANRPAAAPAAPGQVRASCIQAKPAPATKAPAETPGAPRRPHPGDILYWVAAFGGACLLLLCATR